MAARNVDYEGQETRSVSGVSALSHDPFGFSVRASLPGPAHHCRHSFRPGDISGVSTYTVENRTFEERVSLVTCC